MNKAKIQEKPLEEVAPKEKPEETSKIDTKDVSSNEMTYKKFAAIVTAYKKQNPVKYAQKRDALKKQLSALKEQ